MDSSAIYGALLVSFLATVVWFVVAVRVIWCSMIKHRDRRLVLLSMPVVGILAAIGTFASALGFAQQLDVVATSIDNSTLTFIASMGRGALLMGGVIVLMAYRPKKTQKEATDGAAVHEAVAHPPGPSRGSETPPEATYKRD